MLTIKVILYSILALEFVKNVLILALTTEYFMSYRN